MASVSKWHRPYADGTNCWCLSYYDANGQRQREFFRGKRAADDRKIEVEALLRSGVFVADSDSLTVADAGRRFLDSRRRRDCERTTIRGYDQHLRLHIEPYLGHIKLTRLTGPKVVQFREDMLDTRSLDMTGRVLATLSMILNHARAEGFVADNVAKGISVKRRRRGKDKVSVPGLDQLSAIRAAAQARYEDDNGFREAFVTLMMTAGLRISEQLAITWSDVDLGSAAELKVERRADRWRIIGPVKSDAGERTIPLMPDAVSALKRWKIACPPSDMGLVFPTRRGRVWAYHNLYHRVWVPLLRDAGLVTPMTDATGSQKTYKDGRLKWSPQVGFHQLRHAAASMFIDMGTAPKRLQQIMGHESLQMTFDRYGHLWPAPDSDQLLREQSRIWLRTRGIITD